jgi:transposase
MAIGRPTKPLNLTAEEREKLSMLARRPKSAQAVAMRARIVLGCSDGLSNGDVAKRFAITGATACNWRERFRVERLEGLLDEPRPGALRCITDAQVEDVITKTLESMPMNSTHWSTRLMAQKTGLSQPKTRNLSRRCGTWWVVSQSSGSRRRPLRRREEPSAGAQPQPTDSPAGARRSGATIA